MDMIQRITARVSGSNYSKNIINFFKYEYIGWHTKKKTAISPYALRMNHERLNFRRLKLFIYIKLQPTHKQKELVYINNKEHTEN